jgi:DNA polymerase (family X)
MATNEQLAQRLDEIAQLMELLGEDSFRSAAHARAARTISSLTVDVKTLDRPKVLALEGVGAKIADKIIEFCQHDRIAELDELRAKVPSGLLAIVALPGVGPKTVRAMWQQLQITDLAGLQRAINDGSLLALPRMGEKAVQKIKDAIALAAQGVGRLHIGPAWHIAQAMAARIRRVPGVAHAEPAGSLRRGQETIGDIDIIVAMKSGKDADPVMEAVRTAPGVVQVIVSGETKTSVRISLERAVATGEDTTPQAEIAAEASIAAAPPEEAPVSAPTVQMDVRVVPSHSLGSALQYFTGSKQHNVRLRALAQQKGWTLNEWGMFREEEWSRYHDGAPDSLSATPSTSSRSKTAKGAKKASRATKPTASAMPRPVVACDDEAAIYKALGLPWVPPEMREDRGEFELREAPALVTTQDIRAELHAHTTASDGHLSIEQLVRAAHARGFHTIAVTDHSQSSTIARGLKPDRMRTHIRAVQEVAATLGAELGIRVLIGSEVDILADGSLDYKDELLEQLDVVVASPHAALQQNESQATQRLLKAICHPLVHMLGHPTGRLVMRRKGLEPAMDELCAAAKEHDVALEVNAHWMRLDLRDVHVRRAVELGCDIAINCDVHHPDDFENLQFGVHTARRGWLPKARCINTWDARTLHAWLARKRKHASG